MRTLYEVIRRPIISEKSTALAEEASLYSFEVAVKVGPASVKDREQEPAYFPE